MPKHDCLLTGSGTSSAPYGTLYGIGVGPGDPDLLTMRAVNVLHSVSVILAAASPKNDDSVALSIAAPHLPSSAYTLRLDFPMTRDQETLKAAWDANADTVAEVLRSGRDAAFLTLGDPLIYSTFGYLMRTLNERAPELPVAVIPGITSFQAAAAKTRTILCESEENFLVVSGILSGERLKKALSIADSAVILKTYRNASVIKQALASTGRGGEVCFASRLGLEGENICRGLDNIPEKPHYLSLLLAPARRKPGGQPEALKERPHADRPRPFVQVQPGL